MRPGQFGARALARAVAQLPRDGARRRPIDLDRDIDHAWIGRGGRCDRRQGDEPGGDQRAAEIVEQRRVIVLPGMEARDLGQMFGGEDRVDADRDDLPELGARAGIDREHERRLLARMVDRDRGIGDLGEGIAFLAERDLERRDRGIHRAGLDRIARLHREGLAQLRRGLARFIEAGQADFAEMIDLAWRHRQAHDRLAAIGADRDVARHRAVIAAGRAQQFGDQRLVIARAAIDLRGVGGLALVGDERGQLLEAGREIVADSICALHHDAITLEPVRGYALAGALDIARAGRVDPCGIGPVDTQIGQGRQDGVGIERWPGIGHRGLTVRQRRRHEQKGGREYTVRSRPLGTRYHDRILERESSPRQLGK